jgi:hypothetical protein
MSNQHQIKAPKALLILVDKTVFFEVQMGQIQTVQMHKVFFLIFVINTVLKTFF